MTPEMRRLRNGPREHIQNECDAFSDVLMCLAVSSEDKLLIRSYVRGFLICHADLGAYKNEE